MEDIRGKMGDAAAMGVPGDAMPTPSANEVGPSHLTVASHTFK